MYRAVSGEYPERLLPEPGALHGQVASLHGLLISMDGPSVPGYSECGLMITAGKVKGGRSADYRWVNVVDSNAQANSRFRHPTILKVCLFLTHNTAIHSQPFCIPTRCCIPSWGPMLSPSPSLFRHLGRCIDWLTSAAAPISCLQYMALFLRDATSCRYSSSDARRPVVIAGAPDKRGLCCLVSVHAKHISGNRLQVGLGEVIFNIHSCTLPMYFGALSSK